MKVADAMQAIPQDSGKYDLIPFHSDSTYGSGDWPATGTHYSTEVLDNTIVGLKALFAIIYGYRLSLHAFAPFAPSRKRDDDAFEFEDTVSCLITACSYAEYYLSFDWVAPQALKILLDHPQLWRDVSVRPKFWILMAKKLRCSDLYFDAMRHQMSKYSDPPDTADYYDELAKLLGFPKEDAFSTFASIFIEQKKTVDELRDGLLRLSLVPHRSVYNREPYYIHTTLLNALKFKLVDRDNKVKDGERANHIARTAFGQAVLQHLVGEEVYMNVSGMARGRDLGGSRTLYDKICRAALTDNPAKFIGIDAPIQLRDLFSVNPRYIRQDLNALVIAASDLIRGTFKPRTAMLQDRKVVYRRARFDISCDGFTYFPLDEGSLPWSPQNWDVPPFFPTGVSLQEASTFLVATLGKGKVAKAAKRKMIMKRKKEGKCMENDAKHPLYVAGYEPVEDGDTETGGEIN